MKVGRESSKVDVLHLHFRLPSTLQSRLYVDSNGGLLIYMLLYPVFERLAFVGG